MGFRPLTPAEEADLAHSIEKMSAKPASAAPSSSSSKAEEVSAVNDQITDAVTASAETDSTAKAAAKSSFKKKP